MKSKHEAQGYVCLVLLDENAEIAAELRKGGGVFRRTRRPLYIIPIADLAHLNTNLGEATSETTQYCTWRHTPAVGEWLRGARSS